MRRPDKLIPQYCLISDGQKTAGMEAKFRSASADGQPAVVAGVGAGFGFLMALW